MIIIQLSLIRAGRSSLALLHSEPKVVRKTDRRPRGSKKKTRHDLLSAAKKIIRTEGVSALTTVRVTSEAGLAQSGFYAHFSTMDECLYAAAGEIAETIRASIAERRQKLYSESLGSQHATVEFYRSLLYMLSQEKDVVEILLHNQGDKSPLGKSMRRVMESIRGEFVNDLWQVAQQLGVCAHDRERVELLAEFILGSVVAAATAMLERRMPDADLAAEELAAMSGAASAGLLQRCLAATTHATGTDSGD